MFLKFLNYFATKLNNKISTIKFNNQFYKNKIVMPKTNNKEYKERYKILFLAAEGYRERNNYRKALKYFIDLKNLILENESENKIALEGVNERIKLLSRLMHEGQFIID